MQHELIWLELAECLGPASMQFRPLIEAFGSPEAIFAAKREQIKEAAPYITDGAVASIATRRHRERAKEIFTYCHSVAGVRVYPYDHAQYPVALRDIPNPPIVIYCQGTLPDLEHRATVGVVGPRHPDAYGEHVTYKLSFEMAAAGAVIVSGLAQGIDGVATAAAIAAGGPTVSVLGNGIDRTYPAHHKRLREECAETGAVITEFSPGTPPNGYNFPMRNRIIAALSAALLVPEAPDGSGSLITARYAILYGRQVFAVPGDITSPNSLGSNLLLQVGGCPALCAMDVIYPLLPRFHATIDPSQLPEAEQYAVLTPELQRRFGIRVGEASEKKEKKTVRETKQPKQEPKAERTPVTEQELSMLDPRAKELYRMLPDGAFAIDALVAKGVSSAEAISALTVFEVCGLVHPAPGGLYEKK